MKKKNTGMVFESKMLIEKPEEPGLKKKKSNKNRSGIDRLENSAVAASDLPPDSEEYQRLSGVGDAALSTEEALTRNGKTTSFLKNREGGGDTEEDENGCEKESKTMAHKNEFDSSGKKHHKKHGKRKTEKFTHIQEKRAKSQLDSFTISKLAENTTHILPVSEDSTVEKQKHTGNTPASIPGKEQEIQSNGFHQKTKLTQKDSEFHNEKIQKKKGSFLVDNKVLESCDVTVYGKDSEDVHYKPLESFAEAEIPENVLNCCRNFAKPSPIQAHAWPFLLKGRDFIGIAATGSGKTLAFGVPALMHVLKGKNSFQKQFSPLVLVLSPTRELAQQIADVLEEAGGSCGVKTACLYGGTSKGSQRNALKSGAAMIVATPGRLQDLVEEGSCSLKDVSFLVLDEADRMLDLGFEPAIRAIVSQIPKRRQTVMFSATWPIAVHQLAMEFQEPNPVKVTVGSQGLAANHDVTQVVEVLDERARDMRLESLLRVYHKSRVGWKVTAVHGDKGQSDRTKAVTAFKDGTYPLLIATDVAARGLDIPDVEYVINYSFPLTIEDYVHRIGRTGRAGRKGIAHTFFTHADRARSGELANVLREAGQVVPEELLKFGTHVKKKESKLYGAHFREVGADAPKSTKITFSDADD
ncbi:hypothetical protein O6H91_04G014600 [Diphasiastrum complanatum]|uniref:Uncharacterized protein n=1 Tax=Diphasiastrum complanatum TaxID=34168 RepID=A0ACC2DUU1_DIPCM|nr:hypothetical protein O6H91_04G014600 [Diphasiastrum complanatum]